VGRRARGRRARSRAADETWRQAEQRACPIRRDGAGRARTRNSGAIPPSAATMARLGAPGSAEPAIVVGAARDGFFSVGSAPVV